MLVFTLCSCSSGDDTEDDYIQDGYDDLFKEKFGTVDDGHDWGFSELANTFNGNGCRNDMIAPAGIQQDEIDEVTRYFGSNKLNSGKSVYLNWGFPWFQHVYHRSTSGYFSVGLVRTLINGEKEYLPMAGTVPGYEDFNSNKKSVIWMYYDTKCFYYEDLSGKKVEDFVIQCINDNYYVGFDFNKDGLYNDYIMKISPPSHTKTYRIIVEDTGSRHDWDFNDLVFDIAAYDSFGFSSGDSKMYSPIAYDKECKITVHAIGFSKPVYLNGVELHELFGLSTSTTFDNTGEDKIAPAIFCTEYTNGLELKIGDKTIRNLLAPSHGKATDRICVPTTYEWTKDGQSINDKYPLFNLWVSDKGTEWNK